MAKDFLGRGWNFPPEFNNKTGGVEMVEGVEDIQSSLNIILSTILGERLMHPTFGWKRDQLLFEPMNTTFQSYLRSEIETAILFFEPRIRVNKVELTKNTELEGKAELNIDFTVRSTNTRNNLVYPFYLEEATEVKK